MKYKIGRHMPFNMDKKYLHFIKKYLKINIIQIFTGNPRTIAPNIISDAKIFEAKKLLLNNNISIVIHASYAINLANPTNNHLHYLSVQCLIQDLINCIKLNGLGVVIHQGKNVISNNITKEKATRNYVIGIKDVLNRTPLDSIIFLETGASQGNEICSKIDELGKMYNNFTKKEKKRIKFCIDTCHIWASGYNISNQKNIDDFFKLWDKFIGVENIGLLHLNNSKDKLNSHLDHHDTLIDGKIPTKALLYFANKCAKKKVPIILETPFIDENYARNEIDLVKKYLLSNQ